MKASIPHERHASFIFICQGQGCALRNITVQKSQSSVTQRIVLQQYNIMFIQTHMCTCISAHLPYRTPKSVLMLIQKKERGLTGKSRALPMFTQHLLCLPHCCHCGGAGPQRSWLLHSVNETGNDRTLSTEGRL